MFVTTPNLDIVSIVLTGVVVAIVGAPCNVGVAGVAEVETLLSEVEALIVRAG